MPEGKVYIGLYDGQGYHDEYQFFNEQTLKAHIKDVAEWGNPARWAYYELGEKYET